MRDHAAPFSLQYWPLSSRYKSDEFSVKAYLRQYGFIKIHVPVG